jgi:predicted CXXCH cytochrome family protein
MNRRLIKWLLGALALVIPVSIALAGHEKLKCDECHITHRPKSSGVQSGDAWSTKNLSDGLPTFKLYRSPSFDALNTDISQPDGASRLCLGCHDGSFPGVGEGMSFGMDDLSRSHPISFTYNSSLASRAPRNGLYDPSATPSGLGGTIAKDMLDDRGKMQCTSCHDVHSKSGGKMLRFKFGDNSNDPLCRVCHNL